MAKKVSARAKRAKRRKAYYRREYIKNLAAISELSELGQVQAPKITVPKNITKASLKKIRKQYAETKKKVKKKIAKKEQKKPSQVELPTKKELAESAMEDPTQAYRWNKGSWFDPGQMWLDSLLATLEDVRPVRMSHQSQDSYEKMLEELYYPAVERLKQRINFAVTKAGAYEVSQTLAGDVYISRVLEISYYYVEQAVSYIDGELSELLDQAVSEALDGL